jgi:hypothetical protein
MAAIIHQRMCAQIEGDFVVFLIGMRINQWLKISQWAPVIENRPAAGSTLPERPVRKIMLRKDE